MAIDPLDLCKVDDVKAWLALNLSNTDDQLLQRLITAQSRYVQSWLNREIKSRAYNETRNATKGQRMMFGDYPVTSVSLVQVDNVVIPPAANPTSAGYSFDDQFVYLNGYSFGGGLALGSRLFGRGFNNVKLSYVAGYASVPAEIEQAVIELVALRYSERTRIGQASKSLGGETVSFMIKDFPADVLTVLNNYKKVVPT